MDTLKQIVFKSQKRVFSLGSEKIHSFCCAAGVGSGKTVTVAARGAAIVCIDLRELFGVRVVFPVPHTEGNGPMGSTGVAGQVSCFQQARTCLSLKRLTPTLGSLSKKCSQSHL